MLEPSSSDMKTGPKSAPKLDATDIRILAALQQEGRITKLALAEKVNLSPTPCWERLKRLETAGYVRGYRADIALEKLGSITTAIVEVTLKSHRLEEFDRFEDTMRKTPEVLECHSTGGGIDYVLKVVAADIGAYQTFIDGLLEAGLGIDRYFTYVVTRTVKDEAQPPVALLARK